MTKFKSSETRGVLAKSYCYFVRQYSSKKLRVRKIYDVHVKACGGNKMAKIIDILDIFTTTVGYTPYLEIENLMELHKNMTNNKNKEE